MAKPAEIEVSEEFLADYSKESPEVQSSVLAEIHYIRENPSRHGSIFEGGWQDPVRFVDVGCERALFWLDSNRVVLLRVAAIPWREPPPH